MPARELARNFNSSNMQSNATLALSALNNKASVDDLQVVFNQMIEGSQTQVGASTQASQKTLTLPQIGKMASDQGQTLFSGKNLDLVYTKKNEELGRLKTELKEVQTENRQYKKLNERLLNRIDDLMQMIEKEASAHTYMYHYPPKGEQYPQLGQEEDGDSPKKGKGGKGAETQNEGQRIKKQYED